MQNLHSHTVPIGGPPSPAAVAALEKIPYAARRMGISVSQFYRVARRDGLKIVKVGERASAAISSEVDAWVRDRIAEATNGEGGV